MKKGMTLIECIIAVFLIAVAFTALAAVYPAVYRKSTQQENRFVAIAVAEGIIESVRALPYGSPIPVTLMKDQTFTRVIEGERKSAVFHIKSISFLPSAGDAPDPSSLASTVTVTVEWSEGTGASSGEATRSITLNGSLTR